MFLVDLRRYYTPDVDATVDEELAPSRGKCQYIPNKLQVM